MWFSSDYSRVRVRFWAWVLLGLAWIGASASRVVGAEVGERERFADGLYQRGMYDLAVREYEGLLRDSPKLDRADVVHFRMGECYLQLNESGKAEKEFGVVFSKYPGSEFRHKAGFRRAEIFRNAGQTQAAIELYDALLAEGAPPDIASASLYSMAELHRKAGRTEASVKALERLVREYGDLAIAPYGRLRLGEAYAATEATLGKAIAQFSDVESRGASERLVAEAIFQRAEALFRGKSFEDSWQAYSRLLTRYPRDERADGARLRAAWAAHNAGHYVQALGLAVEAVEKAISTEKDRDRLEWLYLRANCERQLKRVDEAIKSYETLIGDGTGTGLVSLASYELGLTLNQSGRKMDGVRHLERSLAGLQDKADAYWLLADGLATGGKADEAAGYYRRIVKEYGTSVRAADATYRLAEYLRGKGETQEASELFAGLAIKFGDSKLAPLAFFAAASCEFRAGNYERASELWAKLLEKFGAHELAPESLFLKSLCEVRLKHDKEARAGLESFLGHYGDSEFAGEASYWLAVLHRDAGRLKESEASLREAMKRSGREEVKRESGLLLARVLYESGRKDEALGMVEPLLGTAAEKQMDASFLRWMAGAWSEKGAYALAERAATLLVGKDVGDAWRAFDRILLARAAWALLHTNVAEQAFTEVLKSADAPELCAEAALRLGDLCMTNGNASGATGYYARAADAATGDELMGIRSRAQLGLGYAAKGCGDLDAASRYFMIVGLLYDDGELVPRSLREAADAFQRLGKTNEAAKAELELRARYPVGSTNSGAKSPDS